MKIKRRVHVPETHRRIRQLSDLSDLLTPHTPIEVSYDFTLKAGEKEYDWHVFIEGDWVGKESTLHALTERLFEIIESQGDDWIAKSTRVNPDWHGWGRISPCDLASMFNLCGELRGFNHKYYDDE
jgi:hypothetical protein